MVSSESHSFEDVERAKHDTSSREFISEFYLGLLEALMTLVLPSMSAWSRSSQLLRNRDHTANILPS